jgi:hypothetical protein
MFYLGSAGVGTIYGKTNYYAGRGPALYLYATSFL